MFKPAPPLFVGKFHDVIGKCPGFVLYWSDFFSKNGVSTPLTHAQFLRARDLFILERVMNEVQYITRNKCVNFFFNQ